MFSIAMNNLFQEKGRLLISVGGVAFSVLLIMVLQGLYQGWSNKIGEYIRTIPADYWVMQSGAEDMFHTPSVLPLEAEQEIAAIAGVGSVKPFNGRRVVVGFEDREVGMYVVAYDATRDTGKPARVAEGKATPSPGEIIVDRVAARTNGIVLGDTVTVAGQALRVAGLSEGGDIVAFSFAFADKQDAEKVQLLPGSANFFLVQVKDGFDKAAVAQKIKDRVANVDVITRQKFVANNTKLISDNFLPVILVLLVIGIAVGIAVIGLTIFTSTIEKTREYGVLKAIGMRNGALYVVVVEQALAAGVMGYALGASLALVLQATLGEVVPQFVSQIQPVDIAWIFVLTMGMAIVAAYLPMRRIAHIDPAEVFKA